jgi:Arc/MetJ-type ribon-helix-helix transcriptional regulator
MTIQLKPEQERIIQEEIERGRFRSPDEVLDHALAALREKESPLQAEPKRPRRNLADVLSEPPFAGSELNLERIRDYPRPLDL